MLNLENVPEHVTKFAVTALIHGITLPALTKCSPKHAAVFASQAGLSFEQFRAAMNWLSGYMESHDPRGLPEH